MVRLPPDIWRQALHTATKIRAMNNAYARPSQISSSAQATALVLETAQAITPTGLLAHPQFFSGSVRRPDVAAAGLRTLVPEIAQTRYFKPVPGGWHSLDPILTAHGDRLRCEAFRPATACMHGWT